ncbi:CYTH and CHAD domain-containing protein [Allopusillimonas ginsengisoli]|uniref:CYTH and CHAD domain-containing protein n=1 Tax=Allopusillimonas ginsengisoli TaxID=453575 RepID=UPI001431CB61|nr:CYTH and CHAD domain-containing protein [Allopusillimonas ginsengisoli]
MLERELKLHVPASARTQIEERLRTLGAQEQQLRARYFDTADRELARAGIALRLRQEGEQWVQTAKAPGPDELSRIELNHPRPGPELDLSVYQDTALGAVLAELSQTLCLRYETDVLRLKVIDKAPGHPHPGTLELAYDRGVIRAGDLILDICELEFELLSGNVAALFQTGRQWMQDHDLVLDLRSKAERGDLLAQHMTNADGNNSRAALRSAQHDYKHAMPGNGLRIDPYTRGLLRPQRAKATSLSQDMTTLQAYQACLADCVNHVIRNATLLAGVDNPGASQALLGRYVHQLRVGMRRLRTCWRFFGKWVSIPLSDDQLRRYFALLGSVSDNDVLRFDIAPRLAKAGMPPLLAPASRELASPSDYDPRALAASAPFQLYLLCLLEHLVTCADQAQADAMAVGAHWTAPALQGEAAPEPAHARALGARLEKRLQKWLRQLCREGRDFSQRPESAQHDLRKKLKRLRYSLEFSASVLPQNRLADIRALLTPLQHAMGDLNDMYNAWHYYAPLSRTEPAALFALGWLRAMQDQLQRQIQGDLDRLEEACRR